MGRFVAGAIAALLLASGVFLLWQGEAAPIDTPVAPAPRAVAVGPGLRDEHGKLHPLEVKAGDRVLFGKWSGSEVKLDGAELMIMKEADIMGVVDHAVATQKAA